MELILASPNLPWPQTRYPYRPYRETYDRQDGAPWTVGPEEIHLDASLAPGVPENVAAGEDERLSLAAVDHGARAPRHARGVFDPEPRRRDGLPWLGWLVAEPADPGLPLLVRRRWAGLQRVQA